MRNVLLACLILISIAGCGKATYTDLDGSASERPPVNFNPVITGLQHQGPRRIGRNLCSGPFSALVNDDLNRPGAASRQVNLQHLQGPVLRFFSDSACTREVASVNTGGPFASASYYVQAAEWGDSQYLLRSVGLPDIKAQIQVVSGVEWKLEGYPDQDIMFYYPGTGTRSKMYEARLTYRGTVAGVRLQSLGQGAALGSGFTIEPGGTCAANLLMNPGDSCTIHFRFQTSEVVSRRATVFTVRATQAGRTYEQAWDFVVQAGPIRLPVKMGRTSANGLHFCVVNNDGTVQCAGDGSVGQHGNGHTLTKGSGRGVNSLLNMEPVAKVWDAVDVASGQTHSCALLTSGQLKCWGSNMYGALGVGDTQNRGDTLASLQLDWPTVDLGPGLTVKKFGVGNSHTCALLSNDQVKCWGYNFLGRLGIGSASDRGALATDMGANLPTVDLAFSKVVDLAVGPDYNCALSDDNRMKCWGNNTLGNLGIGESGIRGALASDMGTNLPAVQLGTDSSGAPLTILQMSAGRDNACVLLRDEIEQRRKIKCWGWALDGRVGFPWSGIIVGDEASEMGDNLPFVQLGADFDPVEVTAGFEQSCAISADRRVKCWGLNGEGQLGLGHTSTRGETLGDLVGPDAENKLLAFGSQPETVIALRGSGNRGMLCALLKNRNVKCWGSTGTYFQEGFGSVGGDFSSGAPELPFNRQVFVKDATLGAVTNCAVFEPATIRCAGDYAFIGFQHFTAGNSEIWPSVYNMPKLRFGSNFACALRSDGEMVCYGANAHGQLGQGHTIPENFKWSDPLDFGTGRKVKDFAVGGRTGCALLDNDRVKCWGENLSGIVGAGDTDNRGDDPGEMGDALPYIDLGAVSTVKKVFVGSYHACAILTNDQVKCWGDNFSGQLGTGNQVYYGSLPNQMGSNLPTVNFGTTAKVVEMSLAKLHSCAHFDDGTAKCWGGGLNGRSGLGTGGDRYDPSVLSPVDLGTGFVVAQVMTGARSTCFLSTTNVLKCVGIPGVHAHPGQVIGNNASHMGDNLGALQFSGPYSKPIRVIGSPEADFFCALMGHAFNPADPSQVMKCWGENIQGNLGFPHDFAADPLGYVGDNAGEIASLGLIWGPLIGHQGPGVADYIQQGDYTYTVPKNTRRIRVGVWGGGGGGASILSGQSVVGIGGSGGGFAWKVLDVLPGQQFQVRVGAGGRGGTRDAYATGFNSGSPGEPSWFGSIRAEGGQGGTLTGALSPGTASGGDLNFTGYRGTVGYGGSSAFGGGIRYSNHALFAMQAGYEGMYPGGGGGGPNATGGNGGLLYGGIGGGGRVLVEPVEPLEESQPAVTLGPNALDYVNPGVYLYVVPLNVRELRVSLWGAGGGGGASDGSIAACGGGGGGSIVDAVIPVQPWQTFLIQIGHGGVGGRVSRAGSDGQATLFSGGAEGTVNLSAGGGRGGGTSVSACVGTPSLGGGFSPLSFTGSVGQNGGIQTTGGAGGRSFNGGGLGGTSAGCYPENGMYPGGGGSGTGVSCLSTVRGGTGAHGRAVLVPVFSLP